MSAAAAAASSNSARAAHPTSAAHAAARRLWAALGRLAFTLALLVVVGQRSALAAPPTAVRAQVQPPAVGRLMERTVSDDLSAVVRIHCARR